MITAPPGVRVLVWSAPVDFRAGMDRLAALVQALAAFAMLEAGLLERIGKRRA